MVVELAHLAGEDQVDGAAADGLDVGDLDGAQLLEQLLVLADVDHLGVAVVGDAEDGVGGDLGVGLGHDLVGVAVLDVLHAGVEVLLEQRVGVDDGEVGSQQGRDEGALVHRSLVLLQSMYAGCARDSANSPSSGLSEAF